MPEWNSVIETVRFKCLRSTDGDLSARQLVAQKDSARSIPAKTMGAAAVAPRLADMCSGGNANNHHWNSPTKSETKTWNWTTWEEVATRKEICVSLTPSARPHITLGSQEHLKTISSYPEPLHVLLIWTIFEFFWMILRNFWYIFSTI